MIVAGSPFTPQQPLPADEAWDDVVARVGPGHKIRGMFISPIAALLDEGARADVVATLAEPPRGGLFVPFLSYPRRDYLRIVLAVARAGAPGSSAAGPLGPGRSLAEHIRRIARNDFATFSASVFGKTIRAAVGTARAALLKTPQVYAAVAPADDGDVVAHALADGRVALAFRRYPILWPYHLGQIEGMVESFGDACDVDVDVDDEQDVVTYRVRLR